MFYVLIMLFCCLIDTETISFEKRLKFVMILPQKEIKINKLNLGMFLTPETIFSKCSYRVHKLLSKIY